MAFVLEKYTGRPPAWTDPKHIEQLGEKYFKECDRKGKAYTVTGLALALDTTRETLIKYTERDAFAATVKRLKSRVQAFIEDRLYNNGQCTGAIFSLKCNFGWNDGSNVAPGGNTTVNVLMDEVASAKIRSILDNLAPKQADVIDVTPEAIERDPAFE